MGRQLKLGSAAANDITNWQSTESSPHERGGFTDIERRWGPVLFLRCRATARFNCHGLTFAARRTEVSDQATILMILTDDTYHEIPEAGVIPGDTILYFGDDGDVEHSGIVLTRPQDEPFRIPKVLSKWGKWAE